MLPRIREAMAGLQSKPKHQGKYRLDIIGWFLIKGLSSKSRFSKFKTTAPFVPKDKMNVREVLDTFQSLQKDLILAIRDADGLPLESGRVVSAFNARVKYNAFSAFKLVAVHELRHLDQAERAAKN